MARTDRTQLPLDVVSQLVHEVKSGYVYRTPYRDANSIAIWIVSIVVLDVSKDPTILLRDRCPHSKTL